VQRVFCEETHILSDVIGVRLHVLSSESAKGALRHDIQKAVPASDQLVRLEA
jgi:hypothetical protein